MIVAWGSRYILLVYLGVVLSAHPSAAGDSDALLDCLCFCGCDALGWDCGVTVDCYYEPNPVNVSPACSNPALGDCVCRGNGCGRAQNSPAGDPCNAECFRVHGGPSPTPTQVGPPTPTRTQVGPPTPTRTPRLSKAIACDQGLSGGLEDGDQIPFSDGTWGDPFVFELNAMTSVTVNLSAFGFAGRIWLGDASDFGNLERIVYGASPQGATLPPGTYVIIVTSPAPLPLGFWAYDVTLSCAQQFTPTRTRTRTPTRTQSRTPSRTPSPQPTVTRTRSRTPTATPTRSATASRSPTASRTATRTVSPSRSPTVKPTPTSTIVIQPTSTSAPTRTATRRATTARSASPTPTATRDVCEVSGAGGAAGGSGCTVDLVADEIEVIQTIQDLENSVDLVAYKRTFVRLHVHALGRRDAEATATLRAELGGPGGPATDLSHPPMIIQQRPARGLLKDSFLFELPRLYLSGRVFLTATINPENIPRESERGNNVLFETISYEEPLPFELVLYSVSGPGGLNAPSLFHLRRIEDGLESMYPISEVNLWRRSLTIDGPASFVKSNLVMETHRRLDLARQAVNMPGIRARHYAVWDDLDYASYPPLIVRGLAVEIPAFIASGAGVATRPDEAVWDTDGSAADTIAAHELAHTLGRVHVEFCGARGGMPFPNPFGYISPVRDGPGAIWGFDALTRTLHPPFWRDIMTYCQRRWISDVTYEALLREYLPKAGSAAQGAIAEVRLLVVGTINTITGAVTLEPLFSMPVLVEEGPDRTTGYAIEQRDANGNLLGRVPFLPRKMEPLVAGGGNAEPPETLFFSEAVRYASGVQRVAITGPGISHVVRAGLASPEVTLLQPNLPTTLSGDHVTVAWEGFDPDGDPLTYRVQYSPDGGASWTTVAATVTDTQIEIDRTQVQASTNALFRVWVSDGVHTGFDTSNGASIVPNLAPSAEIVEPVDDATVVVGQTLALVGSAYDVDQGPLPPEQLRWLSSIDGAIGNGSMIALADLGVGEHVITFEARDAQGSVATDTIGVRVVASASQLPPVPNQLVIAPSEVVFDTRVGMVAESLTIDNSGTAPLQWQAHASAEWIDLAVETGVTRTQVEIGLDPTVLGNGTYEGTVTFSSASGGSPVQVLVQATVAPCAGDCDGSGSVTIDELVRGVDLVLTGAGLDTCRALDLNGDESVTIDELIRAIESALNGCS